MTILVIMAVLVVMAFLAVMAILVVMAVLAVMAVLVFLAVMAVLTVLVVMAVLAVMTVLAVLANSWQFSLQVYFQAVTELLSPRLHPDMCTQTFPRGHPFLGDTPQSSACRYLHTTSSR